MGLVEPCDNMALRPGDRCRKYQSTRQEVERAMRRTEKALQNSGESNCIVKGTRVGFKRWCLSWAFMNGWDGLGRG